jgi:predicted dehydrogenase
MALLRVLQRHPAVEIAALCDSEEARLALVEADGAARVATFEALLEQGLDVAVIATPMGLHASQSIAALQAGVHVLCEVPAVATLDEAAALAEAARQARGLYMLAENCNYWAFVEGWQALVSAGRVGDPMYAEAEYIHDCRSMLRESDGSPTWRATLPPIQYCTHSLGPLLKILGGRCVEAVGMSTGSRLTPEFGTQDMQVALLRTDRGVPIKLLCGFGVARRPSFHHYCVYGTRGFMERPRATDATLAYFEDVPGLSAPATLPLGVSNPDAPGWATAGGHGTAEWSMINAFIGAIRDGRSSPIDVHAALDMTLPGLCAHLSSQSGSRPVAVPDYR